MSNLDTSNVIYKLGEYTVHKSADGYNVINTRRSVVTRISKTLLDAVQYIESLVTVFPSRSEERRVGKECLRLCRSRWSPYH